MTGIVQDEFNPQTAHHTTLSKGNKTATRRKWLSDGGLVYYTRKIKPTCINTYRFGVSNSSKFNIWIGLEQQEPKYEWWFRLSDGKKFESDDNEWLPYSDIKIKNGDIVTMIVDG